MLTLPILYPSGYFEKNKKQYMNNLSHVDTTEDWRPWILFFLRGLENQANLAINLGLEINILFKDSRTQIDKERSSLQLVRVLEYTFINPFITASKLSDSLGIPKISCNRYLKTLEKKKVIELIGDVGNTYLYANTKLLDILRKI